MVARWNSKKLIISILFVIQIILITTFIYIRPDASSYSHNLKKVQFFKGGDARDFGNTTYLNFLSKIHLKYTNTRQSYVNFNTSLCYLNGTDLNGMRRSNSNWNCQCLPGWHGIDCGEPEIIWRAFLTYRKPIMVKGPRKYLRRVIYVIKTTPYTKDLTEIAVNDLEGVVDIFVLYENRTDHLQQALNSGYLKKFHHKILYLNSYHTTNIWQGIQNVFKNIANDDLVLSTDPSDIPNKFSLFFLKRYDKWPEPISFRLRWTVYGFFWAHPKRTILKGGASTVSYLRKSLNCEIDALSFNRTIVSPKSLKIGDLNHYGGWFCEFCTEGPLQIIEMLSRNASGQIIGLMQDKIDRSYVEDLIENGAYLDGKTELLRARRYSEVYYAPQHALQNDWKYDFLLINLYSKLDYY